MLRLANTLCACILAAMLVTACKADGFTRTSVCEVFAHADRYAGKQVLLHARYVAEGMEGSRLEDSSCPNVAVGMRWTTDKVKLADLAVITSALRRDGMGTYGSIFEGDFSGPIKLEYLLDEKYHPTLVLEKVENLRIRPDPSEPKLD